LFQSLDPVQKNGSDFVDCQIPQKFNKSLENIFHLNEVSSREFTFEPVEEEEKGSRNILAIRWMKGPLESELRHLLQIGLGILGLGIVHIEQCE
jgi:hypothetical protein